MKRTMIKLLSLTLACLMLLSVLPLAAFAVVDDDAIAEGNLAWREDFETATKPSDVLYKYPAAGLSLESSATDKDNRVLQLALEGIAPSAYYLVDYAGKKATALSTYTLSEDGKSMTGVTASVNGKKYTNVSGTINTNAYSALVKDSNGADVSSIYIATGELADALCGISNTAKANYFKNPALLNSEVEAFVLEMNVYIPVGAHAEKNITTQIGGTKVSDGSEVQLALFWLTPNGSTATLNATDRQGKAYLEGSAATLTLGDWHRITMVIDKDTAVIDYYVDGEFAYTARNQSTGTMAEVNAPINITKDSILFQVNRLHLNTEMLQGILQIDDVALYTSTDGLGLTRNVPAFRQDFESSTSIGGAFYSNGGSLSAALVPSATDDTNQVVQVDLKGMSPNGEYCLVDYNGKYCGVISGYTLSADGKSLSGGTATVNKKNYTNVSGTINTTNFSTVATADQSVTKFYVCTGALADARCGAYNVARALTFKNSAVAPAAGESLVMEMSIYLSPNAKATKTINSHVSGVKTTDGTAVSVALFALTPNGKTATLGVTDKSTYVRGGAATVSLGEWHRFTFVFDPETSVRDVFVDGKYAYTAKNNNSGALAPINAPISLKANAWSFQFNRLTLPGDLAGFFQVDNASIYTSTEDLGLYVREDFEAYEGSIGNAVSLGTAPHAGATYAQDPVDTSNVAVKVPFDALENNTEILMRMEGKYPVSNGYYTVTRNAETGEVEVEGKTVTKQDDGTYTVVDGSNTYTGVKLATLKDYYDYWGDDGAVNQNWKLLQYDVDYRVYKTVTLSADYYISADARGRFQTQLHKYKTNGSDGSFLNLYSVDAATGKIGLGGEMDEADLIKGAWNSIALEIELATGNANLYVNGVLVKSGSLGVTNIAFDGNNWCFCKVPRKVSAYYGSYEGFFMVDNVQMNSEELKPLSVESDGLMYVSVHGTRVFENALYLPYGTDYEPVYFDASAYAGMLVTEDKNSIRLTLPTGLRFATRVDKAMLDSLFALVEEGSIAKVEFGTMIAPTSYTADTEFTLEAFEAAGRQYLKVLATKDHYYAYDNDESTTHFVGSIVNFYEQNIARSFAGRGFVNVTLKSGEEIGIYSDYTQNASASEVAQKALDSDHVWNTSEREVLEMFANCVQPPLSESAQMKQDLSNLNVLAIGDSHFNGSDTQWMTLLSNQLGWNLTNLGKSGWTVACNPEAYPEGERVRNSMYDYLYNSSSYVYGSTNSNYYTCGDTSGKTAEDVDLILFEGGWNDFMWGIPLGTVDSKDGSTLQGARNLIIEKLLADYPNAKIVILTEWHRDGTRKNDSETRLNFVSDSLKALYETNYAENDRVVLIDAGDPAVSGVDMTDASWYPTYAPDQTHLNEEGMKIFAENILPYLWEAYTGKEAQ